MTTSGIDQRTVAEEAPRGQDTPGRNAAAWAAGGYVAIFILAIFANFLALEAVLQPGEAAATAAALRENEGMFRWGAAAFLGIFVIDVVVAWALYVLFRPVQRDLSLLAAWFRLTYTVVLGAAIGFLYAAAWLADAPSGLAPGTADDGVLLALQVFEVTWVVGLAAFGAHLVVVARLLLAAAGPRWLGWLLVIAGSAYIVDAIAHLVLADYEAYSGVFLAIVAAPSVLGELSLTGWLLWVATGRRRLPTAETSGV